MFNPNMNKGVLANPDGPIVDPKEERLRREGRASLFTPSTKPSNNQNPRLGRQQFLGGKVAPSAG